MLDACTPLAMAAPGAVADDAIVTKHRRDQLLDPAVAAVGKDSTVSSTELFDAGAAVVHRIVAIPGATGRDGEDA